MSDIDLNVYNAELIALSAQANEPRVIDNPDLTAKAISPICGSEVTVALKTDKGVIVDFGYAVEACALTKSVIAVMQKAIIGKTREDVASAASAFEKILAGEASLATGDWAGLAILAPLKDYRARHNAMMLPFEAVEKAFKNKA